MTLGLTIGNLFMFQSLLVGEIFGAASFGTVLGMLTLVSQVFGSYQPAIRMLVVLTLISALLLTRLRPARRV
jgi:hypothetical protein